MPQNILHETETRNMHAYRYGSKGFTLSMIERAVQITGGAISGVDINRIIELGKAVLRQELELLPGVRETLESLAPEHQLLLITKGDLLDREGKTRSSLAELFVGIEILSEKDASSYRRALDRHGIAPQDFVMVGNSLKSAIAPVLELGSHGIHVPYAITAKHEQLKNEPPGVLLAGSITEVPALVRELETQS